MKSSRSLRLVALLVAVMSGAGIGSSARAAAVVSGFTLEDNADVAGVHLAMNGAGWRQRGNVRIDVSALYTQQRVNSLGALDRLPGVKRIELIMLLDVSGALASRAFVADFEAAATPAEFAQLINDVSAVGALYSDLPRLRKGDVITMDVIPGKGIAGALNGHPMVARGSASPYIGSDLMTRVLLRMYVGANTSPELRDNLLGLSASMRDVVAPKGGSGIR